MYIAAITIGLIALAFALMSVGVIFKKRTPLKGSCHASPQENNKGGHYGDEMVCDTCSCGKVATKKL